MLEAPVCLKQGMLGVVESRLYIKSCTMGSNTDIVVLYLWVMTSLMSNDLTEVTHTIPCMSDVSIVIHDSNKVTVIK